MARARSRGSTQEGARRRVWTSVITTLAVIAAAFVVGVAVTPYEDGRALFVRSDRAELLASHSEADGLLTDLATLGQGLSRADVSRLDGLEADAKALRSRVRGWEPHRAFAPARETMLDLISTYAKVARSYVAAAADGQPELTVSDEVADAAIALEQQIQRRYEAALARHNLTRAQPGAPG